MQLDDSKIEAPATLTQVQAFHEEIETRFEVLSLLVGGSSVDADLQRVRPVRPHSDLDVVVVVRGEGKLFRGNKIIDGVRIEYFLASPDTLQRELLKEQRNSRRSLANLLAGSVSLLRGDTGAMSVQTLAQKVASAPVPILDDADRLIYFSRLRNIYEDLQETPESQSALRAYLTFELVSVSCEISLRMAGRMTPHRKLMLIAIKSIDPILGERIELAISEPQLPERAVRLFEQMSELLGVKVSDGWEVQWRLDEH